VTITLAITGAVTLFIALKGPMLPASKDETPIEVLSFIHLNTVLGTNPEIATTVLSFPLQTTRSGIAFTVGIGLTVIVKFLAGPKHFTPLLVYSGITVTVAVTGEVLELTAVNAGIFPTFDPPRPIEGVLFVHLKIVPGTASTNVTAVLKAPAHKDWSEGSLTVGVGFTVMVND